MYPICAPKSLRALAMAVEGADAIAAAKSTRKLVQSAAMSGAIPQKAVAALTTGFKTVIVFISIGVSSQSTQRHPRYWAFP